MLLVIGGTGFVGSALVNELVRRGHRVRVTMRDPSRATVLPDTVELLPGDLADEDSLRTAAAGCDGVFLVAGLSAPNATETRTVNVAATATVLRVCANVGVRRVVFTSTTAAVIDATGFVGERSACRTALTDPYAMSKADSEALLLAAANRGQDVVIVSPAAIYGPSPRGPLSYNTLFAAVVRGEVTDIVDARIGWVLAEDVAIGHALAYERGGSGRRYILCGQVASFPSMLNGYAELVGSRHRVRALPPGSRLSNDAPLFAKRSELFGMLRPQRVDDRQARGLGFAPRGVEEGIRLTASWMLAS